MIRRGWLLIVCMVGTLSCDKAPPPPRIAQTQAANDEPASPPPPTTQELMSGPYKTVNLSPLPLSAQVPESWECKTLQGSQMSVLQGPAPGGSYVLISLETSESFPPDKLDGMLEAAKKISESEKKTTLLCAVRQTNGMKILETQNLRASTTQPDKTNVDWTITCFVRRDVDYAGYALNVYMPQPQFDQTKELISKIFDSVTPQAPANGL
jgi:hypothetical protein